MSENILSVQNLHTSFHTDKGVGVCETLNTA